MAGGTIAEFLASVGFAVDDKSLKGALLKVAGFGAAVSAAAGAAFAGIVHIAQGEAELAAQADKLGVSIEKMEELGYVAGQTGASAETVVAALGGLQAKYPHIKDTSALLERVGARMAGMSEQAQRLYASRMGIDPSLIPMLTRDVSALKDEFSAMYAVAGTDARQAAEDSKGFLAEIGKLKTLSGMLAKSVGLAFIGRIRGDVETLRRVIMDNFAKIKRLFEVVIGVVLRIAGAVGAFVRRVVTWAAALVNWYDKLGDGQKRIVQGVALLLAAWKLLNAGFLATPLGMIVAGLAAVVALVDDYLTYMEGGESYFDWGPWAGTIEQVVAVLNRVWDAVYAVGAAILSAAGPALKLLNEQCLWIVKTIASLAEIIWKVFSGDFTGAVDAARGMLADWAASGTVIVRQFCAAVSAFFGTLWSGVSAGFPNFAAWAEGAADSIKSFFGPAVQWVKDKLAGLTDWLPDWVKEQLGLSVNVESPDNPSGDSGKPDGPPHPTIPTANLSPPPSGPALTPSPGQALSLSRARGEVVTLNAKTEITVNGAQSPAETASKVAAAQNTINADMVRHARGAAR